MRSTRPSCPPWPGAKFAYHIRTNCYVNKAIWGHFYIYWHKNPVSPAILQLTRHVSDVYGRMIEETQGINSDKYSVYSRLVELLEASQIVNALETKEVDMAGPIQLADAEYIKSLGYNVMVINGGYPDAALFSLLPGGPLESKEVRWVVSHAIDRQAIVDVVYEGLSAVAVYPASQYDQDFEPRFANMHDTYSIGYNPEKARELAEQSGLVGKTLRIITNGATNYVTMAEMIQENLLDIGVNAEIINYDQATYFPTIMDAANFDIALFNPAAPSMLAIDILANYPVFIPLGWTGPERDRFGEISMDAISTFDKAERGNKLYEALKVWVDVDPWFALSEVVAPFAQSPDITGVEYLIAGSIYYQDIAFK
ncbi:MAG: hypothetical protein GX936_09215 [Clostridiales bacterium]|nr:hypothetical protein [Clostridiales bacterium]